MARSRAMNERNQVETQFGASAEAYASSEVHRLGASLRRFIELAPLGSRGVVLDVATGAGATALAFASSARQIVGVDITHEMLTTTRKLAAEEQTANLNVTRARAEFLPFGEAAFQLVTCRLAAHHFRSIPLFLKEVARVLSPDGSLLFADQIVPDSHLGGKEGNKMRSVARYVNALERLRDPSHNCTLGMDEWRDRLWAAGFRIVHQETVSSRLDFEEWARRMRVTGKELTRLRVMMQQAPKRVKDFLSPKITHQGMTFALPEVVFLAQRR